MNSHMPEDFPEFGSEDEMREWFDTVDLSQYDLQQALEVVVAHRVRLSVGEPEAGSGTVGATGTLREPVHLVRG